mmetsp:Transcript_26904/g.60701  ORF Transcript_26904/g.60701 Transcript_26904/m.60701 type:complete len:271 (-) Transcript_26904:3744-4556(-)
MQIIDTSQLLPTSRGPFHEDLGDLPIQSNGESLVEPLDICSSIGELQIPHTFKGGIQSLGLVDKLLLDLLHLSLLRRYLEGLHDPLIWKQIMKCSSCGLLCALGHFAVFLIRLLQGPLQANLRNGLYSLSMPSGENFLLHFGLIRKFQGHSHGLHVPGVNRHLYRSSGFVLTKLSGALGEEVGVNPGSPRLFESLFDGMQVILLDIHLWPLGARDKHINSLHRLLQLLPGDQHLELLLPAFDVLSGNLLGPAKLDRFLQRLNVIFLQQAL